MVSLSLLCALFGASLDERRVEVPVRGLVHVAVEAGFACGLTAHGEVWCWELGVDVDAPASFDVARVELEEPARQIVVSGDAVCARAASGRVDCARRAARFGPELPALDALAGARGAFCGISAAGRALCWDATRLIEHAGRASALAMAHGQVCWLDEGRVSCAAPLDPQSATRFPQLSDATAIAAGAGFVCARRRSKQILCFGPGLPNGPGPRVVPGDDLRGEVARLGPVEPVRCGVDGAGAGWCEGLIATRFTPSEGRKWPGALGTANTRTFIGGGRRGDDGRFDLGVRADVLFGEPHHEARTVALGPMVELRTSDLHGVDVSLSALAAFGLRHGLSVLTGVGLGEAWRRGGEDGGFAIGTVSVVVRAPIDEGAPERRVDGEILYAFDVGFYASLRVGLEAARTLEWSAGFESPLAAIGASIFALVD